MTATAEPQFHKARGALDKLEAADADGKWWTIQRSGARWQVLDPDGRAVGGAGETSKERAITAARIAMAGGHVEPPATHRATDPVPVSAVERRHRDRVRALGCIVADHHCGGPIEYAHLRPRKDGHGIGLCEQHHRLSNVPGVAYHKGDKSFCERYASEVDLLALVNERLAAMDADPVSL